MPPFIIWASFLAILTLTLWIAIYEPEILYSVSITRNMTSPLITENRQIKLRMTTGRNMTFFLGSIHEKALGGFAWVQGEIKRWIDSSGDTWRTPSLQTLTRDLANIDMTVKRVLDRVLVTAKIASQEFHPVLTEIFEALTTTMIHLAPFLAELWIVLIVLLFVWAAGKIWAPLRLVVYIFGFVLVDNYVKDQNRPYPIVTQTIDSDF